MTPAGFSWFIGTTALLLTLPLFAVLGTPVAWVLMMFFGIALLGMWKALFANKRHMSLREELSLSDDHMYLAHVPAKGPMLEWEANPHWVTVNLRKDGPVKNYLTLRGGGREVELGAFLTPEEREGLFAELQGRLSET